jgi:pilus assembly protein Flp/PilA
MDFLNASQHMLAEFSREDDGAQIVEYGMIVGAVSLVLIGLLAALATNSDFSTMVGKIANCLTNTSC